ncbi:MAG: helix-turn-helix transcriptional regulator, partial [Eubacteriales bacterium]|nr:helix-turn-helix transcriptional regulator [Eubacteriales bacterium]
AAKLAETAEMSIPHFRRTFRQLYGVPPAEYINNIRIIRAKDMLRSGMYSVGEVAAGTGFKNIYYFSRFFKKNTGVPPSGFM